MKFIYFHFRIIFVFFIGLVFSLNISAQQNQFTTTVFETKEGKITIVLPELSTGDKISGTVSTDPSGKSSREIKKNETALNKYKIILSDIVIPVKPGIFTLELPAAPAKNYYPLEITNSGGQSVKTEQIPVTLRPVFLNDFTIPPFFLAGDPARIQGNFDGDIANTNVKVNGQKAELLAESPGQLYLKLPENISGQANVECTEQGKTVSSKTNILNLEVSAGKLNLLRGETTSLKITVSGLEGLKENVPITIQNKSPNIIQLSGGDDQRVTITPGTDAASGTYTTTRGIVSTANGSFSINVGITPPSAEQVSNVALCNCYIDQQTYLIPPEICANLGGVCDGSSTASGLPDTNQPELNFPPSVTFSQPQMNEETDDIPCTIVSTNNDVAAVIFSVRSVSDENWKPVGNGIQNGNFWQANWSTLDSRNGIHTVRARVVGKNDVIIEKFAQVNLLLSPESIDPFPSENISLNVSSGQVKNAEREGRKVTDSITRLQAKLDALQKKYENFLKQEKEDHNKALQLETIDKTLDKIPGLYKDSLTRLVDSLNKLKAKLPAKIDAAALQKAVDDAAQRVKDCEARLNKLKQEKDKLEKERDAQKQEIEDLLKQMDALHHDNNWIGGHGYHSDGDFWYGYVGDERANTNISPEANALKKKLKAAKNPHNRTNNRLKNCNNEIADAEAECDKLKKALENAKQAAKEGNQYLGAANQVDELCRQIDDLMSALRDWCAANPATCNFKDKLDELSGASPRTPQELSDYLAKLEDITKQKQKKEADLNKSATENSNAAAGTAEEIKNGNEKKAQLGKSQKEKQAEADNLRKAREKQLEEIRENIRKKREEEEARRNAPKPQPTLKEPVNPLDDQLKAGASRVLKGLLQDYAGQGCDCPRKAILFSKMTNSIWSDLVGRIGVAVAFAPLEAFPGLSFGARLGVGAMKALGSSLYGGQKISDELAKNLFNVIGGEIFPKLVGSDFAGGKLNELAGGGLDAIMREEGVRAVSWEGEANLQGCGKVKGNTTMLFNPNTGWVTMIIRAGDCLVVVKYQVNKSGVAITKPIVKVVKG